MDVPTYSVGVEEIGKTRAIFNLYYKLMPYHICRRVAWRAGQRYKGIFYVVKIYTGYNLPVAVFVGYMCQTDTQCGGLDRVEPTVVTLDDIMIAAVGTVVRKCTYHIGQFFMTCCHGAGIAECTYVFCGIEAECRCISKCSCSNAFRADSAYGLSVVLDYKNATIA